MTRLIFIVALAFAAVGCSGIYDMNLDLKNSTPKIVVNSIITPDSVISVRVCWSRAVADTVNYQTISGAEIEITEEDVVVFRGTTNSIGVAQSDYRPRVGRKYHLRVLTQELELTASTSIPDNSELKLTSRQKDSSTPGVMFGRCFVFADISSITPQLDCRGLYITFSQVLDDSVSVTTDKLFTNSSHVDPLNGELETYQNALRESNHVYSMGFVRIPKSAFSDAAPMTISTEVEWRHLEYISTGSIDEWGAPMYEIIKRSLKYVHLNLITPSDEYGLFCRSACNQMLLEATSAPFVPGGAPIYSNIKNGLGIFAGYNTKAYDLETKIPNQEQDEI